MSYVPPPPDVVYPNLSFPDPIIGPTKRSLGQGCQTCVHQNYCRPFYWLVRLDGEVTPATGTQCASWSNLLSDQIKTISMDDTNYNTEMNDQGLLIEKNRNGFGESTMDGA